MEYLKILKKDRLSLFILFWAVFICSIPFFIRDLNILINAQSSSYTTSDISSALKMVIIFPIFFLLDVPSNKFFFSLLLDIKMQKQCTASVQLIKAETSIFYGYVPGRKSKNDYFYRCIFKPDNGKRIKIIVFKDLTEDIKGKIENHTYSVTYYKYSKVAAKLEKFG